MKKLISIILVVASFTVLFASCKTNQEKILVSGNYTYVELEDNTAKIIKYTSSEELLELEIPASLDDVTVTVIGSGAFSEVANIGAVTFPETITLIESDAFSKSSIKKAYLHRCTALTEIQPNAFAECHNLVQVDLPSKLETIGENAFYYCDSLKIANFRGDTANIHQFAFDACPKVKIYTKQEFRNVINFAQTYHVELSVSEK